jgi:hypothetical protein
MPAPVKIEPPRVCIDFHGDAVIRARLENSFDIDVIAGTAQELPACHVAENGDERVSRPNHWQPDSLVSGR